MKRTQKPRTQQAKQRQTAKARALKNSVYPLKVWIEGEYRIGMSEGRWKNRSEAASELTATANDIAWCYRGSLYLGYAATYSTNSGIETNNSKGVRKYSRRLYLMLGKIESELKALGITYPS